MYEAVTLTLAPLTPSFGLEVAGLDMIALQSDPDLMTCTPMVATSFKPVTQSGPSHVSHVSSLDKYEKAMAETFDIQLNGKLGTDPDDEKHMRVLM